MVLTSAHAQQKLHTNYRSNLLGNSLTGAAAPCSCDACVGVNFSRDHWEFLQTMPTDPVDMVGDLAKMGLYKDQQLKVADKVNAYELRKALLLKTAGKGDPNIEKLVLALAKQAGGIENAFAAAFGPQAGLFFADSIRGSGATRREFLKNLAIGAAMVALTNCASPEDPAAVEESADVDVSTLEKTDLKIGFIPITCATPIIMSEPLGFYKKYGFNAEVVKMPSWGAVRDSAIRRTRCIPHASAHAHRHDPRIRF